MPGPTTQGVVLTEQGAAKLKVINDAFNQQRKNMGGKPIPHGPIESEIWGLLTGCDTSGKRYSFVRVIPDASGDDPDIMLDAQNIGYSIVANAANQGLIYTAFEVNGHTGAVMQIVKLTFAGYRKDPDTGTKEPVFVFQYETLPAWIPLPVHDHRDNVTGGGFAFAVYAPGTALPQQPFSI